MFFIYLCILIRFAKLLEADTDMKIRLGLRDKLQVSLSKCYYIYIYICSLINDGIGKKGPSNSRN
jgi:hypothetical protein